MTRLRAVTLLAVALATTACSTKDDTTTNNTTNNTAPTPIFTGTYTLQGFVADATTGARIGGDLQLFLIEGAAVRTPTRLNGGASDPLLGEFAFAGIPLDWNDTNKTYKVVAIKPGYQRFEAEISNLAVLDNLTLDQIDSIYNMIGNIFMFPIGATTPSYQFTVLYNGKPVPGATVVLDPAPNANNPLFNTAHALGSTTGYIASLTATTDANGVATFPGSTLALGAAYQAQVLPVTFVDSAGTPVPLSRFDGGANVIAGLSNVHQTIAMADLVWDNLYVVSTSNDANLGGAPSSISPTGALVVTFSAPVTLRLGTAGFSAALDPTPVGTIGDPQTTATLSPDGLVLTLRPNFSTTPTASNNVAVTFGNGTAFVEPRDYPGISRLVFGATGLTYVGNVNQHVPARVWLAAP